jgi:glycosyltransferase involved in cell wall biosynthesis
MDRKAYFDRLDELVFKYRSARSPAGVCCQVVPNGVAVRPARLHLPAAPRFLVSGRIAPSKRLNLILEAFRQVCATHATAELHVVGSAEPRHAEYARSLVQQAAGLRVVFRGARPQLDFLAEPFTAAVVLGTHQGSPNAVLEAMAAGIPVIANASGGSGEIVIGGANGWLLAEECTIEALAQAMQEAVADTARNLRFGQAARSFVQEQHAIEGMVEAYLALLENFQARPPVAAAADLLAA